MFGIFANPIDGNLMSAPKSFDFLAIDYLRTSPALRSPKDDEGPARWSPFDVVGTEPARLLLYGMNSFDHPLEDRGHALVHWHRFRSLDHERLLPVAAKKLDDLVILHPPEDGRIRDFVTIEMKDWQHSTI